jgi:P-type conjugative transfer protein TrbJ
MLAGLLSLVLLSPHASYGILGLGDIVSDPITEAQTALSAARTLMSNVNEATQIQQQLTQIAQEAKQLVALPTSVISQFTSLYQQYADILNQGNALSWQVQSSVRAFDDLFAQAQGNASFLQRAQRMAADLRQVGQAATAVQAIYARLCNQQSQIQTLLAASQAAPGTLSALQAQNQLMGVLLDQGGSLQQIAATTGRMQVEWIMQQQVRDEAGQQWVTGTLADWPTQPMRGPGQGQGPTLP